MDEMDLSDVYKPPRADLTESSGGSGSAVGRLYSPGQVAGATLLGTPLAGCFLLARNFAVLGDLDARTKTLVAGFWGTVALIIVGSLWPARVPLAPWVVAIGYTSALWVVAKRLQGAAFATHRAAGGPKQSSWRAAGIGLLGFVIFVGALMILAFLFGGSRTS